MTAIPQPTTEAGVQALVEEYNRERGYKRARVIQGIVCLVIGVLALGGGDPLGVLIGFILPIAAIVLFVVSGLHSRRARDLRLQAKLAADAAGVTIQE